MSLYKVILVDDEEENRPFEEGQIESADPFLDECSLIVEVAEREEVACRHEEERHVELIEKDGNVSWAVGMSYHHENDGDALADRDDGVAFHIRASMEQPCSVPQGINI